MKNITYLSLGIGALASLFALYQSVLAIEINDQTYCKLTIKESETNYKILVPQEKVDFFREISDLEVVGINCRNQIGSGYQNAVNQRGKHETSSAS